MTALGQALQVVYRPAGAEVRLGPKGDLILIANPVAHASRLCNRAEEYGHARPSECCRRAEASAME
jgi:hypothetical protein